VSADGRHLVSGGKDATIRCFDTQTTEIVWLFDGHTDYINRIVIDGLWRVDSMDTVSSSLFN
jgi:WD40 repeat protein